jgi:hypothetical protein
MGSSALEEVHGAVNPQPAKKQMKGMRDNVHSNTFSIY